MKPFLQKVLLFFPDQQLKVGDSVPTEATKAGLVHYQTPIYVFQYFIKMGFLMLDAIVDAIIIAPLRFLLALILFQMKVQFKLDLIHTLIIWFITWVFTFNYFEVGFWYHTIRGQSQIKLYGIIQILDLLDRLACTQGDYIMRKLYWQTVQLNQGVCNRYLLYSLIYVFSHSCILGMQLTVYNVIFSQKVQLLYLALFVLSLIKLKGSVFKKQDEKSCIQTAVNDGREYFQKILYIVLISMSVKFTPQDYYYKISFYFFIELLVDSFKYISIFHLNSIPLNALNEYTKKLSNFIYAIQVNNVAILDYQYLDLKDIGTLNQVIPPAQQKIIGKFNIVIFPQVIITLKMLAYNYQKHYNLLKQKDYIIIFIIGFLIFVVTKLIIQVYFTSSQYYKVSIKQKVS